MLLPQVNTVLNYSLYVSFYSWFLRPPYILPQAPTLLGDGRGPVLQSALQLHLATDL